MLQQEAEQQVRLLAVHADDVLHELVSEKERPPTGFGMRAHERMIGAVLEQVQQQLQERPQ